MKCSNADKWFSKYIRIRDSITGYTGRCCTCGKFIDIRYNDCGHYIGRQNFSTRFDEHNAHLQCKKCNAWEEGRKETYSDFIVYCYGEKELMRLRIAGKIAKKMGKFELDAIAEHFKTKAQEIAKEKGLSLW